MTSTSSRTACALVGLLVLGGCRAAVIGGDGPMTLAAVDPALLEAARLLMFSFTTASACSDLVDLSPVAIGDALPEDAPRQAVDHDGDVSHVFGDVPADTPVAFLVLASAAGRDELDERIDFADLDGTVFALACRDYRATSGTRVDLPLTLFPVGLR